MRIMAEVITIDTKQDYSGAVARAVAVLDGAGLVVFPTETVYGVGARADRPRAMERLRKLKERTDGKPFTVHIADRDRVYDYVPGLCGVGRRLAWKGWPGPLTLLLRVSDPVVVPAMSGHAAPLANEIYHDNEVGLRCPAHEVACQVLSGVVGTVVAASANRAGHPPPRTASEALAELGDGVDVVLDAGLTEFGKSSTVVRSGKTGYEVVREGVYDARMLRRLASMNFLFVCSGNTCRSPMAAGMFREALARQLGCPSSELGERHITIQSAGTFAGNGSQASAEAVEVMHRRDIDITGHRSTRLSSELINQADHIYVMTRGHAEVVTRMAPNAQGKTRTLCDDEGIGDPIGGSVSVYESCADKIEKALTTRLREVEL